MNNPRRQACSGILLALHSWTQDGCLIPLSPSQLLKQEREGELFSRAGSNDVPSFFSRGFVLFYSLSWACATSMRTGAYWFKPLSFGWFVM